MPRLHVAKPGFITARNLLDTVTGPATTTAVSHVTSELFRHKTKRNQPRKLACQKVWKHEDKTEQDFFLVHPVERLGSVSLFQACLER